MRLVSPIDGRVEKLEAHQGELADAQTKVIRVVKIDPLWIDAKVPLDLARQLCAGGAATVEFFLTGETATGKVVFCSATADYGSKTLMVRVEVPNPTGRVAGEDVKVRFACGQPATAPAATQPVK